jgi:hypothetical protein
MKIEIDHIPQDDQYFMKIYDGPDGIDEEDFLCYSLGECFEEVVKWRTLNAQHYYGETQND